MKRIVAPLLTSLLLAAAAFAQTSAHDRMFADSMTKHHQDGIRMAQMAADKAESADLRAMARKMIDDQRADIDRMQALRGEGPMTTMHEMMAMPGMMPESEMQRDMARLESTQGPDFDAAFTEIMAKHHQGGVAMANHELQNGTSAGMKEIAREIADKQTRERAQLLAMNRAIESDAGMTSAARERMTKD